MGFLKNVLNQFQTDVEKWQDQAFSFDSYEYDAPDYLEKRAESGYTAGEKKQLFASRSLPSILNILRRKQATQASVAATGLGGGISDKAVDDLDTQSSLELENIMQGVEDESLQRQESAMQQITQLEMQYKQAMVNKELALAQMRQQESLAKKQNEQNLFWGVVDAIF